MEFASTSMIHAAAPHFLWPFAVRYVAHQLNLWPRVSHPETPPTLRWTGDVGDVSEFRPVALDFGAAEGGDTGGADSRDAGSGGAECPTGTGGAGGAAARGTAVGGASGAGAGGTGARWQETLLPERLRKWAVRWGSPGGGAGRTGGGGADTGGATGGTGVLGPGASRQEPLFPQQLREGDVATGAGGSGGATTQSQPSALSHLLTLPPAVTEFPVAGTTPPLLFPPPNQSQRQLLPHSPLPAPALYTAVTESLTKSRKHASRPVTPLRTHRAVRPRPPPVPGTHIMAHHPSSISQRVVLPSPPASDLPAD
ncbi:unnamed protein product [Closterium sp. NIES-54]